MRKYAIIAGLLCWLPTIAMAQMPTEVTLKVKTTDLEKIGKALGRLPFDDVAELMQSLRQQVIEQSTKPVDNSNKEPDK